MLILEALGSSDDDIRLVESCGIFSEISVGSRVGSRASDGSRIVADDGGKG